VKATRVNFGSALALVFLLVARSVLPQFVKTERHYRPF
jgi:hypothetical protein